MASAVTRLRAAPPRTVRSAAEAYLDTIGSPNTRRAYTIAIVKTADRLERRGPDGPRTHCYGGTHEQLPTTLTTITLCRRHSSCHTAGQGFGKWQL